MTEFFDIHGKWYLLSCFVLFVALGFWTLRPPRSTAEPVVAQPFQNSQVHYVTPQQLTESAALTKNAIPVLTALTDRDQQFTWPRPDDRRPLLLIFVKDGCPCSVEMEPYFHRLEEGYSDVALFAGVIDADVQTARRYAKANDTPYPILADAEWRIIHRLRAKNGVYVALLIPPDLSPSATAVDGQTEVTIDTLWPGCSAEMFAQMGQRIAQLAGVAERPLEVCGLSSAPITGCPFPPSVP